MRLNEPKCDKCLKTLQAERIELSNKRRGYANKDETNANVEKNANDKSNDSVKTDDRTTSPSTQKVQESSNNNNDGSVVDDYDECDFDDDDNDGYSRSRKKLSNRNVTGAKNSDIRGGSRGKKKPNYREELSDHNSSSERENRRPLRAAAKRNRFVSRSGRNDSDLDDSDDEEEVVQKTTVTSRGRVCKPNPRVV